MSQAGTFTGDGDEPASAGMDLYHRHQKTQTTMSRPSGHSWADAVPEWPPKGSAGGNLKGKGGFINHHNNFALEDDSAFTPDFEKDDPYLAAPQPERKRFAKMEQRTIFAKNLSDRATHKDVVDFARGGLILDIYLRSHERSASISFVEGSAAQDFMNHVKRNDIYVHGKRVCPALFQIRRDLLTNGFQLEFTWSERQYNLPGHVGNKISIGALIRILDFSLTTKHGVMSHGSKYLLGRCIAFCKGDADFNFSYRSDSKRRHTWDPSKYHRGANPRRFITYPQHCRDQRFFREW